MPENRPEVAPPGKALGEVKGPAEKGAPGVGMAIGGPHAETPPEVGPGSPAARTDSPGRDFDERPPATPRGT